MKLKVVPTASREAGEPASEFLEFLDPKALPCVVIGDERFLKVKIVPQSYSTWDTKCLKEF